MYLSGRSKSFHKIPRNDTAAEHGELGARKEVEEESNQASMMDSTTVYQLLDDAVLIKTSSVLTAASVKRAQTIRDMSKKHVGSELSIKVLIRSSPISYSTSTSVQEYHNTQSLPNRLHSETEHASMASYSVTTTLLSSSATATSTVLPMSKVSTPVLALSLIASSLLPTITSAAFQHTETPNQSTSVSVPSFAIFAQTDFVVTKSMSTTSLQSNINSKLHTSVPPKSKSVSSRFAAQETKQIFPTLSGFMQLNTQSAPIQLPESESIILNFQYLLEEVKTIFRQWHHGYLDNLYEECSFTNEQLNNLFNDAEAMNLVPMSDADDCFEIEKLDSDIKGEDSLRTTEDPLLDQIKLLVSILKKYFDEGIPCRALGTVTSTCTGQRITVETSLLSNSALIMKVIAIDKTTSIKTSTTRVPPTKKIATCALEQLVMATESSDRGELTIIVGESTKLSSPVVITKPLPAIKVPNSTPLPFQTRLPTQMSIEMRETKIDRDKSLTKTMIAATRTPSSSTSVSKSIRRRGRCPSRWYSYPLYIFRCRRGRRIIPHPYNCRKFILCWRRIAFIGVCRQGMVFNPLINLCDWSGYQFC